VRFVDDERDVLVALTGEQVSGLGDQRAAVKPRSDS
jgi:hypothetical protein